METYSYVDIFETKGLEYMLLIIFMVLLVVLYRYTRTGMKKKSDD